MTAMTRLTVLLLIIALDTWKENVGNVAVKIAKGKTRASLLLCL